MKRSFRMFISLTVLLVFSLGLFTAAGAESATAPWPSSCI